MSQIKTDLSRVALAVRDFLCQHNFTGEVSLPILREATLCYPERGGKALRPAILLWSAQLFNSNLSETEYLDIASAVELFHTWTLVHDDIIDQDELRRGKASVHTFVKQQYTELPPSEAARFGQNMALLAGDLQQAWVNQIIIESQIFPGRI